MISIQIINYKSKKYLSECLRGLFIDLSGVDFKYEINILENSSGENLDDLKKKYPKINLFEAKINLGFGQGHNWLASLSKSEYLLLLNPDIEFVESATIKRLLNIIMNNKRIGVIGPKLITNQGKPQAYDHAELNLFGEILFYLTGLEYWTNKNNPSNVRWVSGAVFLIRRELFKKLNGFDKDYFLYGEEVDLCLRTRKLGINIQYEPSIIVKHYGSVSGGRKQFLSNSIQTYLHKHLPTNLFAKWLNLLLFKVGTKFLK